MSVAFFESYWKDYIEYSASVSFGLAQIKREIDCLGIKEGEEVANVGIDWGEPLVYIFERCPKVKRVVGIDYSPTMIKLSKALFSEEESALEEICKGLNEDATNLLKKLRASAERFRDKVGFVQSSAEELYKKGFTFDKIAATMGLHWLGEPKVRAFASLNGSLRMGGELVFSTSSAFYQVKNPKRNFINNSYYQGFYKEFERVFYRGREKPKDTLINEETHRYCLEEVIEIIGGAGFSMSSFEEFEIELDKEDIDKAIKAGIKLRYDVYWHDKKVKERISSIMDKIKENFDYDSSESRFEICPIFKLRKIRDVSLK